MRKLVKVILVIFALTALFGAIASNTVSAFGCSEENPKESNLCP